MYCIIFFKVSQAQLVIQSGAEIRITGNGYICLNNTSLQNDGTINQTAGTGKYVFTGTANNTISGSGSTNFDVFETAKSASVITSLNQNIGINGSVLFTSGIIDLNAKNITLQSAATLISESESSRIIGSNGGYIAITQNLNVPLNTDPGNLGAVITCATNLGSTFIKRTHKSVVNGLGIGSSILRVYEITPSNNISLNATLRLKYFDAELNSLAENNLVIWKSTNGTNWQNQNYTLRDATANYVEKTGIPDFSIWTLSTNNNVLPIKLISFNAINQDCKPVITWKSATEQEFGHFELESSKDGIVFNIIASIQPKGNNSSYTYNDNLVSTNGNVYYRLKMIDLTGNFSYSNISSARINCSTRNIVVYPIPTKDIVTISGLNASEKLMIYDATGKLMMETTATVNTEKINLQKFASGSYLLKIVDDKNTTIDVKRLAKE